MPDTPDFEVPEQMRDFADKSVDQAKKAFDSFMESAQKAVTVVEDSTAAAQANSADMNRQALDFAEENVASAFDFAQKLLRATDIQELMTLQSQFVNDQMSALGKQTKAMSETVAKAASDTAKVVKD